MSFPEDAINKKQMAKDTDERLTNSQDERGKLFKKTKKEIFLYCFLLMHKRVGRIT